MLIDWCGLFLISLAAFYLIEQYLRVRKGWALKNGLPKELSTEVTQQEYDKTCSYNMAKNDFGYVSDAYGTATNFLQVWLWPIVWQLVSDTALSNHDLYNPCVFALSLTTLETILGEPVAIYSTFVIEERFGFNNYTAGSYIKDKLKNFAVNVLIEAILWVGLILVVDWAGKNAWFYLWVFLSLFVLVFNMLYPVVIAPLTNTFKPLEEGELKKGIEQLIAQTGLNCKKVFEVDGSKQSKHSNAYVAGMLGTKRIVIYDTLVTDLDGDIDMIKSVVGHEIGHSIEHHQWVLLVTSLVNFFILFWTYGFFQNTPSVVTSFGFKEVNTYLSLRCFMTVYTGLIFPLWMVAMNAVTRWLEFRADRYSARLGYDIRPSLLKISKTNKGDLNPDWLHSLWHHNHPPLLERLHAVTEYMKKSK